MLKGYAAEIVERNIVAYAMLGGQIRWPD